MPTATCCGLKTNSLPLIAYPTFLFSILYLEHGRIGEVCIPLLLAFSATDFPKALRGSEHVEFLVSKNLLDPTPSASLDVVYPKDQKTQGGKTLPGSVQADKTPTRDVLLLDPQSGKKIAEALQVPELAVEIERAVHQVEASIKAEIELNDEKQSIARATNSAAEPVDKGSK